MCAAVHPPYQSRIQSPLAFDQRLVARRDSGEVEFYYRRISAANQKI